MSALTRVLACVVLCRGEDVAKTKNDYAEEVDAYTAFKAKGNFTAHPEGMFIGCSLWKGTSNTERD